LELGRQPVVTGKALGSVGQRCAIAQAAQERVARLGMGDERAQREN
jgi:hypothetical protein